MKKYIIAAITLAAFTGMSFAQQQAPAAPRPLLRGSGRQGKPKAGKLIPLRPDLVD